LLEQKATKIQGFIKFKCFCYVRFLPRHASRSPRNWLQEKSFGNLAHFCMACNALRLKTFLEKLLKFSNAGPFIPDYTCGNILGQRVGFIGKILRCRDRQIMNYEL